MEKTINRHRSSIVRTSRNIVKRQDLEGPRMPRTLGIKSIGRTQVNKPVSGNKRIIERLERNNEILFRLRKRLDSYLYEPKTYELFERKEYLKDYIETIKIKNSEIIGFLMQYTNSVGDYLDFTKTAFSKFYDLKRRIEEYMLEAHDGQLEPI